MSCENGIVKVWSDITGRNGHSAEHPDPVNMWGDVISHFVSDAGINDGHPSQDLLSMKGFLERYRIRPKDAGRTIGVIIGNRGLRSDYEIEAALNGVVDLNRYTGINRDYLLAGARYITRSWGLTNNWDPRQPKREPRVPDRILL